MDLIHLNPESLMKSPAFSQGVLVRNPGGLVFVGGQNGINAAGELVGESLAAQTEQACKNLLAVLEEAHTTQRNVVKMTIYLRAGQDAREGYMAAMNVLGAHPTAITAVFVPEFARPGMLVEIEAVAAVETD